MIDVQQSYFDLYIQKTLHSLNQYILLGFNVVWEHIWVCLNFTNKLLLPNKNVFRSFYTNLSNIWAESNTLTKDFILTKGPRKGSRNVEGVKVFVPTYKHWGSQEKLHTQLISSKVQNIWLCSQNAWGEYVLYNPVILCYLLSQSQPMSTILYGITLVFLVPLSLETLA